MLYRTLVHQILLHKNVLYSFLIFRIIIVEIESLNVVIVTNALLHYFFATGSQIVATEVTKIPGCAKYEIFHSDRNYLLYNFKMSYVM